MSQESLLQTAQQEKLYAAERRISVVRLAIVVLNIIVFFGYMDKGGLNGHLAYGISVFALVYGLLTMLYQPYRYFAFFRSMYYTAITDGALIVAWLMVTGGMDSPFFLIWYVSLLAVALRYSIRETVICTLTYALLYECIWLLSPVVKSTTEDVILRFGYLIITGMVGVIVAMEIKEQLQDRVKVKLAEQALLTANAELEERVEERTLALSTVNNDLKDSINYAQRIQQAILPSPNELKLYQKKMEVLFLPKDVVSGDFFWCHHFDTHSIIAVVDCTGHGVPGALMSMIGNNLLNNIVIDREIRNPKRILGKMNLFLNNLLNRNIDQYTMNDGMDMSVLTINRSNGNIKFGAAYGQLVLVRAGKAEVHYGDRNAIGGLERNETASFNELSLRLQAKDRVFMFTDGIQDQFGGPNDRKFLRKNLLSLLEQTSDKPIKNQFEIVKDRFLIWKGNNPQTDDVTLLGFEVD